MMSVSSVDKRMVCDKDMQRDNTWYDMRRDGKDDVRRDGMRCEARRGDIMGWDGMGWMMECACDGMLLMRCCDAMRCDGMGMHMTCRYQWHHDVLFCC